MTLYARSSGSGPRVLLLHGLFGASGNLGALGRSLQEACTVHAVDLPGHGRSPWLESYSLAAMADCVRKWMHDAGLTSAHLVGHSLGGKVAMQLALDFPESVNSLTVADIAPVAYSGSHEAVFRAMEAVSAAACSSREEAAGLMRQHLEEEDVIQFLLASLARTGEGRYGWRLDLEGLRRDYGQLLAAPAARKAYAGPVLFIKGAESDYIQERHRASIEALFPAATYKVVPDAGHWLHVQKPGMFNTLVQRFLQSAVVESDK